MIELQIGRYNKRIAEEESLAAKATSPDMVLVHRRAALLYRSELAIIRRKRALAVSEMLSEIG